MPQGVAANCALDQQGERVFLDKYILHLYNINETTTTVEEEVRNMKKSIRRLPDAELEVMNAVWACPPPAARTDIEAVMNREHPMAPTTLLTLLTRLGEKGFLQVEKRGRANVYTPLIPKRDYLAAQSRRFVEKLCGGDMGAFAAALCDSGLSREEIEELRTLLEKGAL